LRFCLKKVLTVAICYDRVLVMANKPTNQEIQK